MTEPDLDSALETSVAGPKKVAVQGMGLAEEHPLPDQIAAINRIQAGRTRCHGTAGIKFFSLTPPGANS